MPRVCSAPWGAPGSCLQSSAWQTGWLGECPPLGQDKVILPLPLAREALPTQVAPRPGNRL